MTHIVDGYSRNINLNFVSFTYSFNFYIFHLLFYISQGVSRELPAEFGLRCMIFLNISTSNHSGVFILSTDGFFIIK